MKILVINCGSSSIKFGLFAMGGGITELAVGQLEKIGGAESHLAFRHRNSQGEDEPFALAVTAKDHREAFGHLFAAFRATPALSGAVPDAIGHRVVHGGEHFSAPVRVDAEVLERIRALNPIAPLHNPVNVLGLEICRETFPDTPQVAIFDTAFHQTLPPYAFRYAVPKSWYPGQGIRRYGFHGTSHQYLVRKAAEHLGRPATDLTLISLHLGNGASATAVKHGVSIDTSMGFSPLEGLVMGSRSGDLDPVAVLEIAAQSGVEATRQALMEQSGLKGLCGGNDLRDILAREAAGDAQARLAVEVYVYRIRKYIGAYFAVLGGIDALIFAGGVGENSAAIRARVCEGLQCLGLAISDPANARRPSAEAWEIQADGAGPKILVIRTSEEREIASQTAAVVGWPQAL